jgi:hypothetical protein
MADALKKESRKPESPKTRKGIPDFRFGLSGFRAFVIPPSPSLSGDPQAGLVHRVTIE